MTEDKLFTMVGIRPEPVVPKKKVNRLKGFPWVSVAVMAGYLGWGYEPIPIIHFAIVFSILSIFVCMFYFVLCAVDYIRAWRQEKRERANEASFL